MKVTTYADVAAEIARHGLKRADVAKAMSSNGPAFSFILADREGRPSAEWVARFTDAIESLTSGIATA